MIRRWQSPLLFGLIALIGAFLITRGLVEQPGGFTDVFYHFNAANRLVQGQGLTDPYLWVYVGMPDSLPAPSHLYWMPLTSLLAALGMGLLNAPGSYAAAQVPFALLLAATAGLAYGLGRRLGGQARHAWLAGLITLFGGFYMRFWGATDTFVPYAFVGSACLLAIGQSVSVQSSQRRYLWAGLVGVLAALGHLTRADGPLLLGIAWVVWLWPWDFSGADRPVTLRSRVFMILIASAVYLLVMLPWFARNLSVLGTPLPIGGAQGIWFTEYNDLFNYPPDANAVTFFADGIGLLLRSRWEAFTSNLGTFVAVEGMIILAPLMLIGLWMRRKGAFLRGFWLYALGIHVVMTLVFPFPGYRGGLLHSSTALLPWWAALGVVGLDDVVDWVARRRRKWNATSAKWIFSTALLLFIIFLSLSLALPRRVQVATPALYTELAKVLPDDARVMINDPLQLYYFTGHGGVVLPNEEPSVIPEIAQRYGVDYLLLETLVVDGQTYVAAPDKLSTILDDPPDFLERLDIHLPSGALLYAIVD